MIKPLPKSKFNIRSFPKSQLFDKDRLSSGRNQFRLFSLFLIQMMVSAVTMAQSIAVTNVSPSPVCAGANVTVTFSVTNGTGAGNYFSNSTNYTLYLSNASGGSFTAQGSPFTVSSGSYNTTDGATIASLTYNFTIPASAANGTGYQISLGSTSPSFNGSSGAGASPSFTINALPTVSNIQPTVAGSICEGSVASFLVTGLPPSTSLDIHYNFAGDDYTTTVTSNSSGTATIQTPPLTIGNDGDVIYISGVDNNATGCSKTFSSTAFTQTITVNPLITPVVDIVASIPAPATITPSVCPGTAITFTATPTNPGSNPTYQWYLNGSPVGSNSTQYILGSPTASDVVKVIMTSNAGCLTTPTDESNQVTVAVKPAAPTAPGSITGSATICPTTSGTYSIAAVANATSYTWSVPAGYTINSGQGTTSINISAPASGASGNISVTASNDCGTSAVTNFPITLLDPIPAMPGTINGSIAVCPGISGLTYSVTSVTYATSYNWTVPTGWSISGTPPYGNSISVTSGAYGQNGTIDVAAVNSCGVSSTRTVSVSVNPGTPNQPGAVTGTTAVCPGTSQSYSISSVSNASGYTWTVPAGWSITSGQGTNSITVTAGSYGQNGDISVTANNSCGNSIARIQAVTVNPGTPAQPGTITGTTPQCPGLTGQTYSIAAVPNATSYNWVVPAGWTITGGQGTTSLTVTTGTTGQNGNISVEAINSCGTSAKRNFAVTVTNGTPATPSTITLPTGPYCANGTGYVFSVPNDPTASEYLWSFPSGWTIQGSAPYGNQVTVNTSGASSGTVSVQAKNSCGTSTAKTASVSILTTVPPDPGAISGIGILCGAKTLNYSIAPVAGATSYVWTVSGAAPSGNWTFTGQGTTSIAVSYPTSASPTSGTISVVASNGCVSSTTPAQIPISIGSGFYVSAGPDEIICTATSGTTFIYAPSAATISGNTGSGGNTLKKSDLDDPVLISGTGAIAGILGSNGSTSPWNIAYSLPTNTGTTTQTYKFEIKNTKAYSDCGGVSRILRDTLQISVLPIPTVSISGTTTICPSNTANITFTGTANSTVTYNVSGGVNLSNQTINIGSSGTATLTTPALSATTTYTVTSVAHQSLSSCNTNASGSAVITVRPVATANAGSAQTICSGSTITLAGTFGGSATSATWTGGTGTFSPNNTTIGAVYTPSAADIAAGTVTLTLTTSGPCAAVTSQVTHIINPAATVNIGSLTTPICQGGTFALNGSYGGGASSITWTTNASGGSFGNASSSSTTYTPAATFYNSLNFTLTTNDPAGPCPAATASVSAYVNRAATADAGTTQAVCSGSSITLAGIIGGSATSSTWTSSNGGSFSNAASLTSSYTPAISSGNVTLILTTNDPDGSEPCTAAVSTVLVTVDQASTVEAGGPNEVCQTASPAAITLSGSSIGGGATNATWSIISGGGSLSNTGATGNPASVTYTPAANFTGQVQLQLLSNATGVCSAVSDTRTIDVNQAAVLDAGADQTICSTGSAVMSASLSGSASSGTWTTSGSGTFNNNSTTATYTPSAADILAGTATLTYTSNDPVGACNAVSDVLTVTIVKKATITTQPTSITVCSSNPATFTVQATGDNLSYQWYRGPVGGGSAIGGATNTTFTIAQAQTSDAGNYHVRISNPTCGTISSNQVTLAVSVPIQITTQPTATTVICQDANTTLTVAATAGGDPLTYQWYKGTPGSGTPVADGGNISGSASNTLSFTSADPTDAGSYYAVITGPAGYTCGTVTSTAASLTVHPTPDVTPNPTSAAICSGDATSIALSGSVPGTTFAWTVAQAGGAAGASAGNGTSIAQTLTTGSAQGTVTYTITPTANSCPGIPVDVIVTVNPKPTNITSSPNADFAICSGSSPAITLTSDIATTFTWTASATGVTGSSNGSASGTSANINTALSVTNAAGTVQYVINNATAAGCSIANKTITVTVNPVPTVTVNNNKPSLCSYAATDIQLSSPVAGASFTWTAAVTLAPTGGNITGMANGNGTSIAQPLQNSGTSPGEVTYTITPSFAGCTGTPVTTVVEVNPLPQGSIDANISGGQSVCLNGVAPIEFTGSQGKRPYEFFYTINGGGSQSISTTQSSSTVSTNANTSVAGTLTYLLVGIKDDNSNDAACPQAVNPPKQAVVVVKPLPTATVATNNTTICVGTGAATVTLTGANGVAPYTFTYKVDNGANQTINSTGNSATISVPNGTVGTKTYTLVSVAENGATPSCSQAQTGSVTVTITPNATISLSSGSNSQSVCVNNSIGNIQYTVGNTGNGGNVTGLPTGVTGTYSGGVLTISGSPSQTGTFTYTATATGTCGPASTTGTITVYPGPSGGTAVNNSNLLLCSTANGGSISLSGQDGTIANWQSSSNGGQTWTNIASTTNPLTFTNIGQTTWYRAVVQKAGCNATQNASSAYAVVSVVPASGAGSLQFTTNPSPAVICTGSVSLTANAFGSDTLTGRIYGGEFDNAGVELDGPGKWRKTLIANWDPQDKQNVEASTNNTDNSAFNLTNGPKTFPITCGSVTYNNNPLGGQVNNNKFMATVGKNTSSLESPIFSLVGLQTASFDWWQAYILTDTASVTVELSFDGGVTYTKVLAVWTAGTYGNPLDFATASLNLNAYVGLSNLRIRFTYRGSPCSSWGMEKATITKGFGSPNYTWSLYDPIPAGGTAGQHYLSQFVNQTVVSTPPTPNNTNAPLTYSYSISSSAGGCGANITVTVNPVLLTTVANPNGTICSGSGMSTISFGANVSGTQFNWTRTTNSNLTFTPNTTSGTGGTIPANTYSSIVNNTSSAQTVTFNITPTNANACSPQPMSTSIVVRPNLAVVLSGNQTFCGTGVQQVKVKSNGPFPITITLSNGQVVTMNSVADSMVTLAPALTATGTVTISSMANPSCNAAPITGSATVTFTAGASLPVGHWAGGSGACTTSGATSAGRDWFNPCNWGGGIVPTNDIDVFIIQSESVCDPIIDPTTSFAAVNGPIAKTRNITMSGTTRNLSFSNGGTLWVAGNWTNNIGPAGFTANTGTVVFMGNSNNTPNCASQTVTTTSGNAETFYNVQINNTCPRDATGDNVVLNSPVNVGGTFTLTDGIVQTTTTNILTITNQAVSSVVGGATNTYVNGPMTRYTTAGNNYNFPIGNPAGPYGPYRPAQVAPTTDIPYTGQYVPSTAPEDLNNRLQDLLGQLNTEYWDIQPTNSCSGTAVIGLPYVNPNNSGHWTANAPCSTCNVAIVKPAPSGSHYWAFTDYPNVGGGFNVTSPETRPYTDNGWIYSKPIDCASFEDHHFTFGYGYNVILPVKLLSFDGKLVNEDARLNWSISDNKDLAGFELEYSSDGRKFNKLVTIAPTANNNYNYTHYKLQPGLHYYRLLMKDKNGNGTYSKTVLLVVGRNITIIKGMKATVVLGTGYVEIWSAGNQKARVQIFDMTGRLLDQQTGSLLQGDNSMPVRMLMLPQGVYNLLVTTDDGVQRNLRLMKE